MIHSKIVIKKASVHNLKEVSLELPSGSFIVFTGVSGSGKSSLAFDTLYVEGQRRYIESLPQQARNQLESLAKPNCESIEGLSPTIAIEQKTVGKNPRSTVGTLTGIYDYLRVLFTKLGVAYCPVSHEQVSSISKEMLVKNAYAFAQNYRVLILSPLERGKKGEFKDLFFELEQAGFRRIRIDDQVLDLSEIKEIDPKKAHDIDVVIDRLEVNEENKERFLESLYASLEKGNGQSIILLFDEKQEKLFSLGKYSQKSGLSYPELKTQDFSFNHPEGMCPECQGLGQVFDFDLEQIIDPNKSIQEDCCLVAPTYNTVRWSNIFENLAHLYDFDCQTPWNKLSDKAKNIYLYGTGDKWLKIQFTHPEKGSKWTDFIKWKGVLHEAKRRLEEASSEGYKKRMQQWMVEKVCPLCLGSRIRSYPAATQFFGKKIHELTALSIDELLSFFETLKLNEQETLIGSELIKEVVFSLKYLIQVGIGYLSLDRGSPTLSGGEAQRVRLAAQLGCGLSGITYILDEPSIGLHPRDNVKLIQTLQDLKSLGNTVIVVEHDEETILSADHILELGPKAGSLGGQVIFQGTAEEILQSATSITAPYLKKAHDLVFPKAKKLKQFIEISGVNFHNLKNFKGKIPLGGMIGIVGVSGSGKSSFISDVLYPILSNLYQRSQLKTVKFDQILGIEHLDKVIQIDQSPIGKTPRSNPSTYIKLWDDIRDLFSELPDAKAMGMTSSSFSFNTKTGSCLSCGGMGMIKIDMDFMEESYLECHHCLGKRFDQRTLSISYKNKNIYDVLNMTVENAIEHFANFPKIIKKLRVLNEVGLSYLTLGQSSTTLSGGEAQRIKLAKELSRPSSGKTLYIFDEPTTGLHPKDIEKLLSVLKTLVDQGNTAWIIEHNTELMKVCDYLIEMGPEAGDFGGQIIAEGTPESFLTKKTPTAQALKAEFKIVKKPQLEKLDDKGIEVKGVYSHNLKGVEALIPYGQITVCSGPSGSGKSSFAFDTIYAEGQRRYVDSLPNYAQQFIKLLPKPKYEKITGLLASIAIEQRGHAGNPRSTVGTMTEIYDYLRILYAQAGEAFCPETNAPIKAISPEWILQELLDQYKDKKVQILAPIIAKTADDFQFQIKMLQKAGYLRLYLNDELYELDDEIPFNLLIKNQIHVIIDRLKIEKEQSNRLLEAIIAAKELGKNELYVLLDDQKRYFNLRFSSIDKGKSYPNLTPQTFSFNADEGMCPQCFGLGMQFAQVKKERLSEDLRTYFDLIDGFVIGGLPSIIEKKLEKLFQSQGTSLFDSIDDYQNFIFESGKQDEVVKSKKLKIRYRGLQHILAKGALHAKSPFKGKIAPYLSETTCSTCDGQRLNPLALNVKLNGISIGKLCEMSLVNVKAFMESLTLSDEKRQLLKETIDQILTRLSLAIEIGLTYLSLSRKAPTLSGGEAQRVRLSQQLGSGLTGVLYVLDEPTIGLHPHNNALLNKALLKIKNKNNTLLLVEHDPMTIKLADQILDFGPKAGVKGGEILAKGSLDEILKNPHSLTGQYLSGQKQMPKLSIPRKVEKWLKLTDVSIHNIHNLSVDIPLGVLCGVAGVSGSGKSSLIKGFLEEAVKHGLKTEEDSVIFPFGKISGLHQIERLISLSQDPMGTTARADISTYVDLLTPLRQFFAQLPSAKAYGLQGKHFSFNHKAGMCHSCWGLGYKKVKLQYLPDVRVPCDSCNGFRFNPLTLSVKYQGKHIGEILSLSVDEAAKCLPLVPKVSKKIELLQEVGLGYLPLNQEIAQISGGEGQRLRLAKELSKRSFKKTLFILDEPTVGLHPSDIALIIPIFQKMIYQGASFIIIEHNIDLLNCCDYMLEMGPGSGEEGGQLIAKGSCSDIKQSPLSITAKYL